MRDFQLTVPRRDSSSGPDERGLTLTELTIVGLLATIVMVSLTVFYFNSQNVWIDGSTQALAQRDATMLVDQLRRSIHEARQATVDATDADHDRLTLEYLDLSHVQYQWNNSDRKIHRWEDGDDKGPVIDTPATRFLLTTHDSMTVELLVAELETAKGDSVTISSRFALLGR